MTTQEELREEIAGIVKGRLGEYPVRLDAVLKRGFEALGFRDAEGHAQEYINNAAHILVSKLPAVGELVEAAKTVLEHHAAELLLREKERGGDISDEAARAAHIRLVDLGQRSIDMDRLASALSTAGGK